MILNKYNISLEYKKAKLQKKKVIFLQQNVVQFIIECHAKRKNGNKNLIHYQCHN